MPLGQDISLRAGAADAQCGSIASVSGSGACPGFMGTGWGTERGRWRRIPWKKETVPI